MGKIVNVVLNSNNAVNAAALFANNNKLQYFIDWGAILKDNKSYRLHWTYIGGINTFSSAGYKLPQVRIDFNMENYLGVTSSYGAPTSTFIGTLQARQVISTTTYGLYCDDSGNLPIYLERRPYNNLFTVSILNSDATPGLWLDNAAIPVPPANYILTLSFQEVDEED